jgi:adenosylcobinamide-GDP ribazoletransferase
MKAFFSALLFITIIPMGKTQAYDPEGMPPMFPLVGLVLGFLLAATDYLSGFFWPDSTRAVINVVFMASITGAFHLDGLADAADGLFSHRPRERMLEIMKDSRTGVMGVVAIICCLGIKWGGFNAMTDAFGSHTIERFILLAIIPSYARGGMLFGIRYFNYGRPEGGTAYDFFNNPHSPLSPFQYYRFLLFPIILSFFTGWGIVINIVFPVIAIAVLYFYKKMLNCITGDMLGAMTEITEALLLIVISAL